MLRKLLFLTAIVVSLHGQTAQFPTAVATDANLLVAKDNIQTRLTAAMLIGATSATVQSSTGWAANMVATIESEQVLVTAVPDATTLTVTRAFGGTSAAAHNNGRTVANYIDAYYHNAVTAEIKAIETLLFNGRAQRAGTVTVNPPLTEGGTAIVVAPSGSLVSTSGTTTSGLQEAINYAYTHGFDLYIVGGNEPSGCSPGPTCGAVVYQVTAAGLTFRPAQGVHVFTGAITINCTTGVGSNPCVKFDSAEMLTVYLPGMQIVTFGTGPGLAFVPTNAVGNDAAFTGFFGKFFVQAVACLHTPSSDILTVPCVKFDSTNGPITYTTFEIIEVLGGGVAVEVVDPPSGKSFAFNRSYFNIIHDQVGSTAAVFKIGSSNTGRITNNYWSAYFGGATSNTGKTVSTFGLYDIFERLVVGYAGGTYGLYWETGSAGGQATVGQLAGSTQQPDGLAVGGDCAKNSVRGSIAAGPVAYEITPAASPWSFLNNTCRDLTFVLTGGTVSSITRSTTGANDFPTNRTAGDFRLRPGEYLKVTYSGLPTAYGIL